MTGAAGRLVAVGIGVCVLLGVIAVMEGVPPMAVVLSVVAVGGVTVSALRKDPDTGR